MNSQSNSLISMNPGLLLVLVSCLLMLVISPIHAQPFQQDNGSDGIVSIEAEHFNAKVSQGGASWNLLSDAQYSGSEAMEAYPNTGLNNNTGYTSTSPRLDYEINFVKTGVHYVWLRGLGPTTSDDSVHVGLDGVALSSSDRMGHFGSLGGLGWLQDTMDGVIATINVASVGTHTLNVWMREDGFILDKIVLSNSSAYVPSGVGPAESTQGPALLAGTDTMSFSVLEGGTTADQNTTLTTSDNTFANYSISSDANWLSASPVSGSTPQNNLAVSVDTVSTGLTPGTYNGTLTVSAAGYQNELIDVSLTVTSESGDSVFHQDNDANGLVSIEAEHYLSKVSQGGVSWDLISNGLFSGGQAMQTQPNTGINNNTGYTTSSPRMDYQINFVKTGIHYIWIRARGVTTSDDSLHVGLNGNAVSSSDRISGFYSSDPVWSKDTMDGIVATINISSIGTQTLNVWMREDGLELDKIVLTTASNYTPTGSGPAESLQGAQLLVGIDNMTFSVQEGGTTSNQVTSVTTNNGDVANYSIFSNASWLSTSPSSGSTPENNLSVNVDVVSTTLPPGTYNGVLTISATGFPDKTISVSLIISIASGGSAFQQDSGFDGIVSIEAEHFETKMAQGGANWDQISGASYSGSAAMQALPNSGVNVNTNYTTSSPRLDYKVNFVKTGLHYVWIRGRGVTGGDDSVHVGLNGAAVSSSDRMAGFQGSSVIWSNGTMDGTVATINVTSTGTHTINVWMREDGFEFDKIVLTTNASYNITSQGSEGPAESSVTLSGEITDDFNDGNADGWTFIDDTGVSSSWQVVSNEYQQLNGVTIKPNGFEGTYHKGTFSYLNSTIGLADYRFSVDATFLSTGLMEDIGVMFRYQDDDNYYRLALNSRYGYTRLEKRVDGTFIPLATTARGYLRGEQLNIVIEVSGSVIMAWMNGDPVFSVNDTTHATGAIGLYTQDFAKFDNVVVKSLDSTPEIVLSRPLAYSVHSNGTLDVSAYTRNVPQGGYVEFLLDNGNSRIDDTEPYTTQYTGVIQGEHTVEAILHGPSYELDRDTNVLVGTSGSYYVSVGDSITNGSVDNYSADNITANQRVIGSQGYTGPLAELLNASTGKPTVVYNEAIGGDKSFDAAFDRIDSILERHPKMKRVLILLGANDSFATIPSGLGCAGSACDGTYKGNMQTLIDKIIWANYPTNTISSGISVMVGLPGPFFNSPTPLTSTNNNRVMEYHNVILNELTGAEATHPDFFTPFLSTSVNHEDLMHDLVHPNALGHVLMIQILHNAINPAAPISTPYILEELSKPGYKQNLIESGNKYYIDQDYTITGSIPSILDNGRWIMTADADQSDSSISFMSFQTGRNADVYVAYDAGAASLPSWITSTYIATGESIYTSNLNAPIMSLYKAGFNSGTTVSFGGNRASGSSGADANANYVVIVVEK